jgi:hypothetical protein
MSFTRFHDDPCRIQKQLQESTDVGRHILNVPGWGDKPCFMPDPYCRLQGWGANLMTNSIHLESDLMGLTRNTNKDCVGINDYKKHAIHSTEMSYPTCNSMTDQTRATHPAWMSRDLEQVNWDILPLNPQENTCFPFQNNLNTRILERDNFLAKAPCVNNSPSSTLPTKQFTAQVKSNSPQTCLSTNSCQ